jgi:uncharacterized membrane-anchored protein
MPADLGDGLVAAEPAQTSVKPPGVDEWDWGPVGSVAWDRWILVAAVAFQILILAGIGLPRALAVWNGQTVLLRVVPVDPRDLFRGDYVILGYEIGQVPPGGIAGLPGPLTWENHETWEGRPVYVGLEPDPDGRHYHAASASVDPPPAGLFLRGTLESARNIRFGIESFYVQEGRGKEYESAILERRLCAEVAIDANGLGVVRRLVVE